MESNFITACRLAAAPPSNSNPPITLDSGIRCGDFDVSYGGQSRLSSPVKRTEPGGRIYRIATDGKAGILNS